MTGRSLLLLLLLLGLAWPAAAIEVPELNRVPALLAEPARSTLQKQRQALEKRFSSLKRETGIFNRDCASVEKDSADASRCRQRQSSLQDELRRYRGDAEAFNKQVAAAESLSGRRVGADTLLIGSLRGEVHVRNSGGELPVGANLVLREGDEIRTGHHSQIELVLVDGSRLRLGPESLFKIEGMQNQFSFRLAAGKLRAMVQKMASRRFAVRTPNVAVAVRGTEFAVSEGAAGAVVEVFWGEVEAMPVAGGETVLIRAGWRLHLSRGGGSRLEAID